MDVARARAVIADHLAVSVAQVVDEADFFRDLQADSLDIVTLTMALEHEFDVHISDDEAERCGCVRDALTLLERKYAERATQPMREIPLGWA